MFVSLQGRSISEQEVRDMCYKVLRGMCFALKSFIFLLDSRGMGKRVLLSNKNNNIIENKHKV